ncbi:UNVERIFIED_CONTAM: hypothetical protein GTU68_021475 [Idotea baltica]|nr:hypothetical protein [Idotea baltica]
MHFRFSVYNIFDLNPNADKAIILEDDILLSPDFILYFHQTAWLLDVDPSIYCINAFSINSIATIASDPGRMKRTKTFPQYGWLINRKSKSSYFFFPFFKQYSTADWDWWLGLYSVKGDRYTLTPEVSRSFHAGFAGAHVTGWEQSFHFDNMIFNQDPNAKLAGLDMYV